MVAHEMSCVSTVKIVAICVECETCRQVP